MEDALLTCILYPCRIDRIIFSSILVNVRPMALVTTIPPVFFFFNTTDRWLQRQLYASRERSQILPLSHSPSGLVLLSLIPTASSSFSKRPR